MGISQLSEQVILMSATVPDSPTALELVSQDETQITLQWEAGQDNGGTPLTGFKVFWSLDDFAAPVKTLESLSVGTNLLDGLVTGDFYSYRVVASNAIGDSLPSLTLLDVVAAQLPTEPTNFIRSTSVTPLCTQISVQWDAPVSDGGSQIIGYTLKWNGGAIGGETPEDELVTSVL